MSSFEAEARPSGKSRKWQTALLVVIALAFGFRVWGVNFGLPFAYHSDEGALVMPALNIVKTGDYRPFRLDYGSAYIYSLTALYIPYFLYGTTQGYFRTVSDLPVYRDYSQIDKYPFPGIFLLPRIFTALLGTCTVILAYLLGKRLHSPWAGLAAAAMMAVMPQHVLHSHFATTDVPMIFVATFAVLRCLDVVDRGSRRDYIWAGILVGLTASTKFSGGMVLGALLLAHTLRARRWPDLVNANLWISLAATAAGFLVATPFALDLPYLLNWLAGSTTYYAQVQGALVLNSTPLYYLQQLLLDSSGLIAIFGVAGWVLLLRHEWRRGLVLLAFPALIFALISIQSGSVPRFVLPVTPYLCVGAGVALAGAAKWLTGRLPALKGRDQVAMVAMTGLVSLLPFIASARYAALLAGTDVRTLARDWFDANVPIQARLAVDRTGPSFTPGIHNFYLTWDLSQHDADWYISQGFDYLIVSEPRVSPALNPMITHESLARYNDFASRFPLVQTFGGSMLGTDNIQIWVYQVKR